MKRKANALADTYIALTVAAAIALTFHFHAFLQPSLSLRGFVYLLLGGLASGMKARLPGVTGTMSLSFVIVLLSFLELNLGESLLIGAGGMIVQCFWQVRNRPTWRQIVFNLSNVTICVGVSRSVFESTLVGQLLPSMTMRLLVSATAYFFINAFAVAVAIALSEKKPAKEIWNEWYFLTFPYFIVGAIFSASIHWMNQRLGWEPIASVFPGLLFLYRSYTQYLDRLRNEIDQAQQERLRAQEIAQLHLRTLEVLAAAIEGRDESDNHLDRLRIYCQGIGGVFELSGEEQAALQAAALLHDIGNLGVSDHILSKAGNLTQEEFEKMQIHAELGADILDRVAFPYPVAAIVRAHHEKWDGTGYPNKLKEIEIPLGARILSAVDCLDASASRREYRAALTIEEAVDEVCKLAGKNFDPRVTNVIRFRYREFEKQLEEFRSKSSGLTPAVMEAQDKNSREKTHFLSSIAAARQETQAIFEFTRELGKSLSLRETLEVGGLRIKEAVPYDYAEIFVLEDQTLSAAYSSGEHRASVEQIQLGEGFAGQVAQNREVVISSTPGTWGLAWPPRMRSALGVPLAGSKCVIGVVSLYRIDENAFTQDDRRILLALCEKLANAMENALLYSRAETSSSIDYLTQLPNARSLFPHLDGEILRAQRMGRSLSVLLGDLNGFKTVNDTQGHLVGNQLLKEISNGLRSICREYDFVARMGGDEFVLVLPEISRLDCEHLCWRLDQVANEAGQAVCGINNLGMSVGVAMLGDDGNTCEQLLEAADRQMYAVKHRKKTGSQTDQSLLPDIVRLSETVHERHSACAHAPAPPVPAS